jgi:hypothetical protein
MKHISKFDGQEYEISKSVSIEDGRQYDDWITLIWYDPYYDDDKSYEEDEEARILIGWYWGDYNEEFVEKYIRNYWGDSLVC